MAGVASVGAFLPLYLFDVKGLPLKQIGAFGVLQPGIKFVASPFWTWLADSRQAHLGVFTLCSLIPCAIRLGYLAAGSFGAVVILLLGAGLVNAGAGPMLDAGVLATIRDPDEWGRHRLWGAVGFGSAVLVLGYVVQWTGSFIPMFAMHLILTVLSVALVRRYLPLGRVTRKRDEGEPERVPLTSARLANILCGSSQRAAFFFVVLLSGVCTGVINNFLFLFLQRDLGAPTGLVSSFMGFPPWAPCCLLRHCRRPTSSDPPLPTHRRSPIPVNPPLPTHLYAFPPMKIGMSRAVTCAAEVPMFWYAGRLIKRLGVPGTLIIACICYVIRFIGYAFLKDPWLVLAIEPLHGVTYALMWNASASYAHRIAPPGLGATSQGILSGVHWGLGQACGALFGGFVYQQHGAKTMFLASAVSAGAGLVLMCANTWSNSSGQGGSAGHLKHGAGAEDASEFKDNMAAARLLPVVCGDDAQSSLLVETELAA